MKYLVHGDDTVSSRNFLAEITGGYTAAFLDGNTLNILTLEENTNSQDLFADKKAVVIENLLTKNKNKKKLIEFINELENDDLLVLWENKKVAKSSFSGLKNTTIREFSLPQVYFEFLDSFAPQRATRLFQMYHLLLLTTEPTQIFYSLLKRLRALLVIQSNSISEETSRMTEWQLGKLHGQLRLWPKERLASFYQKLQDTEIKLKSGKLPLGLSKHLDILILSEL